MRPLTALLSLGSFLRSLKSIVPRRRPATARKCGFLCRDDAYSVANTANRPGQCSRSVLTLLNNFDVKGNRKRSPSQIRILRKCKEKGAGSRYSETRTPID